MKQIVIIALVSLVICSCEKENVNPVYIISKDSIEAKNLNISVKEYIGIRNMLNNIKDEYLDNNTSL